MFNFITKIIQKCDIYHVSFCVARYLDIIYEYLVHEYDEYGIGLKFIENYKKLFSIYFAIHTLFSQEKRIDNVLVSIVYAWSLSYN